MNKFYSTVLVAAAAIFAPAVAEAATPADVTITVGGTTGTLSSHSGSSWNSLWTSTQTNPRMVITSVWVKSGSYTGPFGSGIYGLANNMQWGTVNNETVLKAYAGDAAGVKYFITCSEGYYASHISFDIKANAGVANTVTCGSSSLTTSTTEFKHIEGDFTKDVMAYFHLQGNHKEQIIKNLQVTLSPIPVAQITYEWKTESGAHLTNPVITEVPADQPYSVNQEAKTFDHYTLVSTSALNGTSITPEFNTNTKITSIYHDERNVIPGVKSLAYSVSAIEAGKTYALFSQHATSTDRDAFRYVHNDNKIYGKPVANLTDETPYFTWVIENADTEGQYKFKNNGNDWYIAPMVHDTQASVSQTAGTFIIESHPDDPSKFRIASATNPATRWDGNGANASYSMNGWNGAGNKITPYEYVIDPYFSVTIEQVRYDSRGNGADENVVVSSTKHLVKAGSDFTLPEIPATVSGEGYADNEYKYSEGADDLTNIQGHKVVKHFYDVRTGVNAIAADSKAAVIYDLMGRKLDNASKPGIYVINGKKVVIK